MLSAAYNTLVRDQSADPEAADVDVRTHIQTSSVAGATTETQEVRKHASVKSVDGQHVTVETVGDDTSKPCVRMHSEHHATKVSVSVVSVTTFLEFMETWK